MLFQIKRQHLEDEPVVFSAFSPIAGEKYFIKLMIPSLNESSFSGPVENPSSSITICA